MKFISVSGRASTREDMGTHLNEMRMDKAHEKGFSEVTVQKVMEETGIIYFATLATLKPECGVVGDVKQKTQSKFVGETIIRNAMSFAVIVARTHFFNWRDN